MSESSTRPSSPTSGQASSPRSPKFIRRQPNGEAAMTRIRITALVVASILTLMAYFVCRWNVPTKPITETLMEPPSSIAYRSLVQDPLSLETMDSLSSDDTLDDDQPSLTEAYITNHESIKFDTVSSKSIVAPSAASASANEIGLFLKHQSFTHMAREQPFGDRRIVRVGVFQTAAHSIDTQIDPQQNMDRLYENIEKQLRLAKSLGVNIAVLEELWTVPLATLLSSSNDNENETVSYRFEDFSEDAENGPTAQVIKSLASTLSMVIIAPILERIPGPLGDILSSAIMVDSDGSLLGVQRSNHPSVCSGNSQPSSSEPHHVVVESQFGRLAVNMGGTGRLHPLNWLGFGLNNAEIVFSLCASSTPSIKFGWMRDALTASSAHEMFVISSNRIANAQGGPKFFGSSFVATPDGSRGALMPNDNAGILIADLDLNSVTQTRDSSKRQQQARYMSYAPKLKKYFGVASEL